MLSDDLVNAVNDALNDPHIWDGSVSSDEHRAMVHSIESVHNDLRKSEAVSAPVFDEVRARRARIV